MGSLSGRILLRMDSSMHQRLLLRAKEKQQSLNDLCLERLCVPSPLEGSRHEALRNIIATADELFKEQLLGVVFYGSQARGEGRTDSDWDLLIITSEQISLSRAVYRRWDKFAPQLGSKDIEVHFVHLPSKTSVTTGFWGEIALDGIVLFEQDFCVSMHLARVRRDIANGLLIRKIMHGQSYWIQKELA